MMRSNVRHNHADDDINKSENKMGMERKRGGGLSILKGDCYRCLGPPTFFSSLPSSPPLHFLWDMITNDEGISLEIWDQFVGSNVLSIAF